MRRPGATEKPVRQCAKRFAAVSLAFGALVLAFPAPAAAQPYVYEAAPVLKAKDLVAPELLRGPNFTVDERVPVVGFLARFTLRSDFGTFDVHGIHMLHVRVPEIYALAHLDKMTDRLDRPVNAEVAFSREIKRHVGSLQKLIVACRPCTDQLVKPTPYLCPASLIGLHPPLKLINFILKGLQAHSIAHRYNHSWFADLLL
jgi:hypothetical protein